MAAICGKFERGVRHQDAEHHLGAVAGGHHRGAVEQPVEHVRHRHPGDHEPGDLAGQQRGSPLQQPRRRSAPSDRRPCGWLSSGSSGMANAGAPAPVERRDASVSLVRGDAVRDTANERAVVGVQLA